MEEKGFVLARIGFEMQELRTMRLEEKFQIKSFTHYNIENFVLMYTRKIKCIFVGDVSSVDNRVENGRWEKCDECGEVLFGRCTVGKSLGDGRSVIWTMRVLEVRCPVLGHFPTELHNESASG